MYFLQLYALAIEVRNSQYIDLPLHAVSVAIEHELALPLKPEDREFIPQRLITLQLCQNAVNSIISLGSTAPSEQSKELCIGIKLGFTLLIHYFIFLLFRRKWQHVRAIQMFVEHIVTKFSTDDKKFESLVKYGTRIELVCFQFTYPKI